MTEVTTAITAITPTASGRAERAKTQPATAPSTPAKKGRPALRLKNGQLYSEALATAKDEVIKAKRAKANAKAELKPLERDLKQHQRDTERLTKQLAAAQDALAKDKKSAELKAVVASAKTAIATNKADVKAAEKRLKDGIKNVDKLHNAYEKATAAKLKVEEQKLKSV